MSQLTSVAEIRIMDWPHNGQRLTVTVLLTIQHASNKDQHSVLDMLPCLGKTSDSPYQFPSTMEGLTGHSERDKCMVRL